MALSIMLTIGTSAFANEEEVNPAVLSSFQREFAFAKDVKWTVDQKFSIAFFYLADIRIQAVFSNDGEFLGTERNLLFNQLPLAVINSINSRFGSVGPYDIIERSSESGTVYKMTIEFANKIIQVQAGTSGDLSIIKKTRK